MKSLLPTAVCMAGLAVLAQAQDVGGRGSPQTHPVYILNATVHTVSGQTYQPGYVTFEKGTITQVGQGTYPAAIDGPIEVINAQGMHLYPGLVSACTHLGLNEMSTDRGPNDLAELGDFKPEIYPATAVNPDSTLIPVARSNGILTFACFASGGALSGHVSMMRADGWTTGDMTLERDAGVIVNWPNVRPIHAEWMDRSDEDQRKESRQAIERIDSYFTLAQAYAARRAQEPGFARDVRLEGMLSALPLPEGQAGAARMVFITAQDVDQITSAVLWAAGRKLRPVIVGGRDAALCSELLKKHDVGVIVLGTHEFPKRDDSPYNGAFTLPARLEAAGVRWCLASGQDAAHERTLPYVAATAAAHGLDHEKAVQAITLSAARILGVSDRLGSIEVGKSATLFLCSGDVLEVASNPTRAWIEGRNVDLTNKQTRLYEKYRKKYEDAR